LREMRRVLTKGGRLMLNMPGPTPRLFTIMGKALGHHISTEAEGFVNHIFSLYDIAEIQNLLASAGFHDVSVEANTKSLELPAPEAFLWQYVHSTPLAAFVMKVNSERLSSLEREVTANWKEFVEDSALLLQVRVVIATARK